MNFFKALIVFFSVLIIESFGFAANEGDVLDSISTLKSELRDNRLRLDEDDYEKIFRLVHEAIDAARNPSGGGEIVDACIYVFGRSNRGEDCIKNAKNADMVKMCGNKWGNDQFGYRCATEGRNADIVEECMNGFGRSNNGMTCLIEAKSASKVESCVRNFGNGPQGLKCALE